MPKPVNEDLYKKVKSLADKKFTSKSGIYRSSWIVKEYKRRGGKYKSKKKPKTGLYRWYKEKWIDLNRPIKNSSGRVIGYKSCGRENIKNKQKYPLCRPTYKISSKTPIVYKKLSKSSIIKAKKEKSKIKNKGNIKFQIGGNKWLEKEHYKFKLILIKD